MFTGIVEAIGHIQKVARSKDSLLLGIRIPLRLAKRLKTGGSLSVNGVCLTVAKKSGPGLPVFQVVRETLRRTTLGGLRPGSPVNIERPLKAGGRLDGHWVLGHVDGVGRIDRMERRGNQKDLWISFPEKLRRYFVEKGSVTVDGVSLTVGKISGRVFKVHCVPYTLKCTTLRDRKPQDAVNLEADVLLKFARARRRS